MTPLRIAVAGATGRMGRVIVRAILESNDYVLAGAFVRASHPELGCDAGIATGAQQPSVVLSEVSAAAMAAADALIDFTTPATSLALAGLAERARIPHVIGTTGFSAEEEASLASAGRANVVVRSGNMSLGVTLLVSLVRQAARALPDFDVEILDIHHRSKVDAPSGTALLLGKAVAEARDLPLAQSSIRGRDGNTGARKDGTIGFASLRGGTVVGEHIVTLAGSHERVILSHVAEDRMIFARGALTAARWARRKPNGVYSMADVLGLRDLGGAP